MNLLATSLVETVERGLQTDAARLTRVSGGRWSLEMANGASHRLEVQLDGDWLQFTSHADESANDIAPEMLWRAANRNAALPAGMRLALSPARRLELRSDLLLTDRGDGVNEVREAVAAFPRVWRNEPVPAFKLPPDAAGDLERRCDETGWSCTRRSSGRLTVALDVTPVVQATVTADGGGVRLDIEVMDLGASTMLCRTAAAALALEITSSFRLVRARVAPHPSQLFFEVQWPGMPTGAELDAGFGALSAAIRAAGESFPALQIENLARDYLVVRGWSAGGSKTNQETTNT